MGNTEVCEWTMEEEGDVDVRAPHNWSKSCGARRLYLFPCACLFLAISIFSIALSAYTWQEYNQLKVKAAKGLDYCVTCSEIVPEGYVDNRTRKIMASLDRYKDNGVQICCARNKNLRKEIIELQLKTRDPLVYPQIFKGTRLNNFNFGDISAHKTLNEQNITDQTSKPEFGDESYIAHLKNFNDARYEHTSGVDVTQSGLKVKVAGLYFVYMSIFFVPDSGDPCRLFKKQTFSSSLRRTSTSALHDSHKDVLLTSEHTCCPDCVQNRETTFTGGMFNLDEGDVLGVEISAFGLSKFKVDSSFIGMIFVNVPVPKQVDV